MEYNTDTSKLTTYGSKFLDSADVPRVTPVEGMLTSCQTPNNMSLGTTCASTFNMSSSYEVPSSYTFISSQYNPAAHQPPLKFSQSSSYIRPSENIVEGINGSSGYDSNFMVKEEPSEPTWDQPTDQTENKFVSTPLQLHFNDSPYNSPNNKSDKSSVHSPSDCMVSPFPAQSPHFSFDTSTATSPGYLVSPLDYPSPASRETTPLHLNVRAPLHPTPTNASTHKAFDPARAY